MEISRRNFMAAAGAYLLVPTLIVRPSYDLHAIVGQMCAKHRNSRKYDLTSPFVQDSRAYGTDGAVMGWINCNDEDTNPETRSVPAAILEIRRCWSEDGLWKPFPAFRLTGKMEPNCPLCAVSSVQHVSGNWPDVCCSV